MLFVDEVPSRDVAQTLFGRLRDELWQVPLVWVVAVNDTDAGSLLTPPADAFFDVKLTLDSLTRDEQADVLSRRAGSAGRQLASQIDEGNVRRLLALTREALEPGAKTSTLLRKASQRQNKVAALGRSASMLVSELEALGPVSASDESLLQRLGWTRERATQVLRRLEAEGVVCDRSEGGEGPASTRIPPDRTRGGDMSYEALVGIEESRAWEPTRRFEDLSFYHVPFDELNGDDETEALVARLTERGARLAIVGDSGSGKSSLISYVLGPLSTRVPDYVVPLRIPVAAVADTAVTDPGEMARYLVRYIARWASPKAFSIQQKQELEEGIAEVRRRTGSRRAREFHLRAARDLACSSRVREQLAGRRR